ncbi:circadian clock protein KaiC [Egicoccus sp. AB-alg2]|uniref:circadian clock protein KaiC n=1 Tax=Egicoccus sp. AB-alg2 TaxID=3242693 RepID=UPI00359D674E
MTDETPVPLERLATGIAGFDRIAGGGLPVGRDTLVVGESGAGKTVLALQFLAEGIRQYGQPGVFVTLGEQPDDLRRNAASLGFDVAGWEQQGSWRFVDASPTDDEGVVVGGFDFSGLTTRILEAVRAVAATRVAIDSVSAAFVRFADAAAVRWALHGLLSALKDAGVTALLTAEGDDELAQEYVRISEHAADAIVRLDYRLLGDRRRRTVEVVKLRGCRHRSGAYPFTIRAPGGIAAVPLGGVALSQEVSDERVSTGHDELDAMCGGGFFRDSVVIVAGATGSGKTLVATTFLVDGLARGERALFVGFEESAGQVQRNMRNWSSDIGDALEQGRLELLCRYPESGSIEEHLVDIIDRLDALRPQRVVIDSLTALERIAGEQAFREFVMAMTGLVKERRITGMYTVATSLFGAGHPTEAQGSVLADTIILLRYLEAGASFSRILAVLKMRGSAHDPRVRGITIDAQGLHIGEPLDSAPLTVFPERDTPHAPDAGPPLP